MADPYKGIRGILGRGSHAEVASGSGAGMVNLFEARRQGVDVTDLVESGTTDPSQTGVQEPKEKSTHVGVRMPGAAKPPVDVRPQTAYSSDGQMVGVVVALITPSGESQEKGSLPEYEITWSGQRTFPYGLKQVFDSEKDAKAFVSNGDKVTWYRPANPDPWEDQENREWATRKLVEHLMGEEQICDKCSGSEDGGECKKCPCKSCKAKKVGIEQHPKRTDEAESKKTERCIRGVKKSNVEAGRPAEGEDDDEGNPWAICKAQAKKESQSPCVPQGRIDEALGKAPGDQ
jgi:hypothetical protein